MYSGTASFQLRNVFHGELRSPRRLVSLQLIVQIEIHGERSIPLAGRESNAAFQPRFY